MDLEHLRKKIDLVDEKIVHALSERKDIVRRIGEYKRKHGLEVFDPKREEKLFAKLREIAVKENLDEDFVLDIFKKIVEQSRKNQSAKN